MLEFKDPKLVLDRAASEGYVALDFADPAEARHFSKRLRRILSIGTDQLRRRAQSGKPLTDEYANSEAWEPLYVNQRSAVVEVIHVEHPEGRKHLPQFTLRSV